MISAREVCSIRSAVPTGALPVFQVIAMIGERTDCLHSLTVESLGRLSLPDGRTLMPDDFLPWLRGTPAAEGFDRAILDRSLAQSVRWKQNLNSFVHIHVNADQATLRNPTYGRYVQSRLGQYKLDPALLTIEVVENCHHFWRDPAIMRTLRILASLGVSLAIDDFPNWRNPQELIAWLRTSQPYQVPITYLKIDRKVISRVCKSDIPAWVELREYVEIARDLGIQIIAEGVETISDVVTMMTMKEDVRVNALQGYAIGRPASADLTDTYFRNQYQSAVAVKETQRPVTVSH